MMGRVRRTVLFFFVALRKIVKGDEVRRKIRELEDDDIERPRVNNNIIMQIRLFCIMISMTVDASVGPIVVTRLIFPCALGIVINSTVHYAKLGLSKISSVNHIIILCLADECGRPPV
jgi:hypothetical protein